MQRHAIHDSASNSVTINSVAIILQNAAPRLGGAQIATMDSRVRHALLRIAILAGNAGTAYLDSQLNPLHGEGTTDDFMGLAEVNNVLVMWNNSIYKVLDMATVNTTIYAIGVFCLFFNCRVLSTSTTYNSLLEAVEFHPSIICQFIPSSLIGTHGFRHIHIVKLAWEHITQLHGGLENNVTLEQMWAILHEPLPLPQPQPPSFAVDILTLLVTAAANNSR